MPRSFIALIALWLVPLSLSAAEVELYQVSGAVASQSEQERREKSPQLLREAVIKIVGDEQAVDNADISSLLEQPEAYIQQYSYERLNPNADNTVPDELALELTFNKRALLEAIERLNLPVWGENRPEMLVWLAVDDNNGRQLLSGDDTAHDLVQNIKATARQRGLPVIFPVMDLEDQTQLTFGDVWSGTTQNIKTASQRYGSPIIVTARVSITDADNAQIRWQLLLTDDEQRWQSQGSPEVAVEAGVNQLADTLGRQFAQHFDGRNQQLELTVTGIRGYQDYQRVIDYLSQLQSVNHVEVSETKADTLVLDVGLRGDEQAFKRTLAYGQVLKAQSSDVSSQHRFELLP